MCRSYRPVFHFSPDDSSGRTNAGISATSMHPSRLLGSGNALDWEHWPIALFPDELGAIFSGSVAVQEGRGEEGEVVACFTHAHERGQFQSLAFSRDEGRTWTKYQGNPVLATDRRDFRDPKIFRYGSEWRMTVAAGFEAQIYASSNLKDWTFLSTFPSPVSGCTWECPDLIELDKKCPIVAR